MNFRLFRCLGGWFRVGSAEGRLYSIAPIGCDSDWGIGDVWCWGLGADSLTFKFMMENGNEDEIISLNETATDSVIDVSDSINGSKRKADDDSVRVIESGHTRKRLCHGTDERKFEDSQIMMIKFQSQDIARKYSKEIANYIVQLTKSEVTKSVERDGRPCLEFYKGNEASRKSDDTTQRVSKQASFTDALPQYDQTFSGVIGVQNEVVSKAASKSKPKNVCFNCNGDHMIAACPEPRDAARIAKNRRAHSEKNTSYSRYHEEAEQKYGHLEPGQLSCGLREALGLREGELPLHTYRMRVQGYPPGWLRAARQQRSMIAVHHEPAPESGKEENKTSEMEDEHYDLNKLISFPGFNVACPEGYMDEHRRKGFPPAPGYWSLRVMRRRLKRAPAAARRAGLHQRRPAADLPSSARTADNGDSTGAATEAASNGDREGSPSLEALEEQRRVLLTSLEEPGEDAEDGELEDEDGEDAEQEEEEQVSELVHAPPAAASTPQTPVLTPGASRRRELGTPVAAGRAHVVYDAEKWSAGITEHIPYENLPGATGAWERMSSLMKRVRDHLTGKK